jgi:ABC-type lipopolysaccharide export system ATPase subunit
MWFLNERKHRHLPAKRRADDGHAYYITVLEDTLKTFEKMDNLQMAKMKQAAPAQNKADAEVNNVFELLEIETVKNENGDLLITG